MNMVPLAVLTLTLVACGAGGFPQTACASNPNLTTKAGVDACRAAARDAGTDVMHAVVVTAPSAAPAAVSKDGGAHG